MAENVKMERLERINAFMRERLIWFSENSFNADESYRVHQQALVDLKEFEKELDEEFENRIANEILKAMQIKEYEDNHMIEKLTFAPIFYYDLVTVGLIHIDHTGKKWFQNVAVEIDPRQTEKFVITSRPM
ncbi:hypothetical protein ABIE27_004708 [Paenibacillus sp. 4624]|uniref:hypothetical protein n=1 Tax=Paenibacillus sp. 4624 TaxID=3156453 RepID=UPI003D200D52